MFLGDYVSVGASREAKANNKYMGKEYDPLLQAIYINQSLLELPFAKLQKQ